MTPVRNPAKFCPGARSEPEPPSDGSRSTARLARSVKQQQPLKLLHTTRGEEEGTSRPKHSPAQYTPTLRRLHTQDSWAETQALP
ncbi:hypothetical protein PAMP_000057 [Pampus punctatissimus]